MNLPVQRYNLARLGNAGDEVHVEVDRDGRAAIAQWSEVVSVELFAFRVALKKTGPNRFALRYGLEIALTQACVVTLEPVKAMINHVFARELHFSGSTTHLSEPVPELLDLSELEETAPEEIGSLHYDLAVPALEEYLLALDPYPRCPGAEFDAGAVASAPRENPFAVLKSLKNRP